MNSIQRRLSISLAVGIALLWLLASGVSALIIHHELEEAADSALRVTARQLLAIADPTSIATPGVATPGVTTPGVATPEFDTANAVHAETRQEPTISASEQRRMEEVKGLLGFVIRDDAGEAIFEGGKLPQTLLVQRISTGFSSIENYRVYAQQSDDRQRSILIAEPLQHRNEVRHGAMIVLSSSLLLLIPLSLVLVWWVVRGSLHEVQTVQQDIESRGGSDLSALATTDVPRELVPMVESVNRLLGRLSRTLESERNFTTNSAHELRTPIASALAQTQRQIVSLPEGTERARSKRIEQTLQELARTSEKLMQLARAESGSMIDDVAGNVYPVIEYLLDEYLSQRADTPRLQLHCIALKQFDTRLDPDGVAILLRNLIDNALKHGNADKMVDIIVDSEHNEIRVINSGAVIPATELQYLKERFRRHAFSTMSEQGGHARAQAGSQPGGVTAERLRPGPAGSGLGLAIAETIAGHAGMTLTLRSPATGRADGFEATLRAG